ncbi:MAG: hypothetical protein FWF90_13625 [Promicromonosporaceae bacterium]|nr:hypothetical protein [Promicromonosporaceae bacterium]
MSAVTERREGALTTATATLHPVAKYALVILRFVLAFNFLWAFFDKTFGWGKATPSAKAWIHGGSPSGGFLKGVSGPLKGFYNPMSGNTFIDILFMVGLLGCGLALAFGVGLRVVAVLGGLLYLMMWGASLPIATNPIFDEHWTEGIATFAIAWANVGGIWGLGKWWASKPIVQKYGWLR